MSEENVEKVRASTHAYNERDLEIAVKDFHEDIVWELDEIAGGATDLVHRGPEAVKRFWADLEQHFEEFRLEPSGFRDAGDAVFFNVRMRALGRGSGVAVEIDLYCVVQFREGRMVGIRYYAEERDALKAAGLSD